MEEIEAGEYVRTDKGYIAKIKEFIPHYTEGRRLGKTEKVKENYLLLDVKQCEIIESIDYSIPPCYPTNEELEKIKKHIVIHSPNIIDLIEVGDYVNGYICRYITDIDTGKEFLCNYDLNEMRWIPLESIDIWESIVTREQFARRKYKIQN